MLLHILYVNVLCYYDFILFKNVSLYKKTCLSLDSMTSVGFLFLFIKKKKNSREFLGSGSSGWLEFHASTAARTGSILGQETLQNVQHGMAKQNFL